MMGKLPKRQRFVGWAFFALGWWFITRSCASITVEDFFHLRPLSLALFPNHLAPQYFFMGFGLLGLLASDALCFITAWGVLFQRSWARWSGVLPCVYLLLAFPFFTVLGLVGLFCLWTLPRVKRGPLSAAEFWDPHRRSGWMVTASILGWLVARFVFTGMQIWQQANGMSIDDIANPGLTAFLLLLWLHVVLHECGHALAAVAVGFRVKSVAVGPFVLDKGAKGIRLEFDWRRMLMLGGYVGAVPAIPRGYRQKQMIVVAAGPATSLATGGMLLWVSRLLPGSSLAHLWPLAAMGSVLGFYIGAVNLLPFGYCDGTTLFHLLFRTRRSDELISLVLRGANPEAPRQPARDYEQEVKERAEAVSQLLSAPDPEPLQVGSAYIALGAVELGAQRFRECEQHMTQGLAMLTKHADPRYLAAGWGCLAILRRTRFDAAGVTEASGKALAAYRVVREEAHSVLERLSAELEIARSHSHLQDWPAVLGETEAALARCPEDEQSSICKAGLLSFRAHALLQTGCVDAGLETVKEAAAILRGQTGDVAPQYLGFLGSVLWGAGRTEDAVGLLTEGVSLLEARGFLRPAAGERLQLAEILRLDGQVARAGCVLPRPENVSPELRRYYHDRRGNIRRSAGHLSDAIADFSAALTLIESEPEEVHLAAARAKLADALAESGDLDGAETMVRQARDVLAAAGHPDLGSANITLAVIAARRGQARQDQVAAALRAWDAAPLLLPADKARELETAAKSLESAGCAAGAADCRAAAEGYWRRLAPAPVQETVPASNCAVPG
jgi:tetratricopeptide (TPR) repeat protein